MSKSLSYSPPEEDPVLVIEFSEADEDPLLAERVSEAIVSTAQGEGRSIGRINVVLTNDEQLHKLNVGYLENDAPTDVLAFDLSDGGDAMVEGDIYISLTRAAEQAAERGQTPQEETVRLAIHGFLHLCGWDHDDDSELTAMIDRGELYVQQTVKAI